MSIAPHIKKLQLGRAIEEKHLAILCGAGISIASPSSLPSWWSFISILLEEIRSAALTCIPQLLHSQLDPLQLQNIPIHSMSEEIVSVLTGPGYFYRILRFLDSDYTNANHQALVSLAERGILQAIISTNFDTLIERAFRERGVPLKAYIRTADYAEPFPENTCVLLKIHGSVDTPETLVDTVSQKLHGLDDMVKRCVSKIFNNNHVLVLGFSGNDLRYGIDNCYLTGYPAEGADWLGVTWLIRRDANSTFNEEAAQILLRAASGSAFGSSNILVGDLPEWFQDIGCAVTKMSASESDVAEAAKNTIRSKVRRFLSEDLTGPQVCAAFCAHLLAVLGYFSEADHLCRWFEDYMSSQLLSKDLHANVNRLLARLRVLRALAIGAHRRTEYEKTISWSKREIEVINSIPEVSDTLETLSTTIGQDVHDFCVARRMEASMQIAAALRDGGRLDEARHVYESIIGEASDQVKSSILTSLALVSLKGGGNLSAMLTLTRLARSLAPNQPLSQYESYLVEAQILMGYGQYALAIGALDFGLKWTDMGESFLGRCNLEVLKVKALALQGDFKGARSSMRKLLQDVADRDADALGVSIRLSMIPHLLSIPVLRDLAEEMRKWLDMTLQKFPDTDPRVQRYRALKEQLDEKGS